jgi:hypothetical protein
MTLRGSLSYALGIAGIAVSSLAAEQQTAPLTPDIPPASRRQTPETTTSSAR